MKNVVFKPRVWFPNSMWRFLICLRLSYALTNTYLSFHSLLILIMK